MPQLTLALAERIADAALARGRAMNLLPMTAAVLDTAGALLVLKREETASLGRPGIAQGKAFGCLCMGLGGRALVRRAEKLPQLFNALSDQHQGRVVPILGGALVRDASGALVGAAGVTGDTPENDEICVVAGIQAAGLTADLGD